MRIVVDTNVLITFFWKQSVFRKLLALDCFECISPEYALEELRDHRLEICRKSRITLAEFLHMRHELAMYVYFIPIKDYQQSIRSVSTLVSDSDDVDFLALAYAQNVMLWSNDKLLKEQRVVNVVSTRDLLENPKWFLRDRLD